MTRPARAALAALSLATIGLGCEDAPSPDVPTFDAGPTYPSLGAEQVVAYEGQARFVTSFRTDGIDLSSAVVQPVASDGSLRVRDYRCTADRCGVVLEILDRTPNRGVAVPRPIDARNEFLDVVVGEDVRRVLVSVWPLDTISNGGSLARVQGTVFASSASAAPAAVFEGASTGAPVRWLVFGEARIEGTLDLSAHGSTPGAGGTAGGMPGARSEGAPGADVGAGGVGLGSSDGAGDGPRGACISDFLATRCGGGGGGGALPADGTDPGGGGGGALFVAALGALHVGAVDVTGGQSGTGGQGGGGGVLLSGAELSVGEIRADARVVDEPSRSGGPGLVIVHSGPSAPTGELPADAVVGPAFDLTGVELLVDEPTYEVRGTAQPGAVVGVMASRTTGRTELARTTADDTGRFRVDVELAPGLNRLVLETIADERRVAWNGTSFVVTSSGSGSVPTSGALDVVHLPRP